ncbi:unnamed protein product [Ambrosiozyma monospora]|uniref:Unnamed protein product n=1 Tax=Ambrosiozyma monospora TaxID=43982 RepID=A0ACB5U2L9_AMBMO|nr:unnamed protein product [Ambrosiozyma monospora]
MTNSTTDDNLDSGVDSDDEGVLSIHQQLEKQLAGSGPATKTTTIPGSGSVGDVTTDKEDRDKEVSEQIATPASTDSTAINAIPEPLHDKKESQATAVSAQTTIAASNQGNVPVAKADDSAEMTTSGIVSGSPSNDTTIPVDSAITPDESEQVSPVSAEPVNLENKEVPAQSSESTLQPPQQPEQQEQQQQQSKDDQLSPSKPVSESKNRSSFYYTSSS